MKKLYRKGTVHPSPPTISDQLSFLPATILTLTVALSPEDREVLAYLISCSSSNAAVAPFTNFSGPRRSVQKSGGGAAKGGAAVEGGDHSPLFSCSCFRCYMSYWIRWDSSPNRQLIHEIIDAFEDWLAQSGKNGKSNRKEKRNHKRDSNKQSGEIKRSELVSSGNSASDESESVGESSSSGSSISSGGGGGGGGGEDFAGEGSNGGGIQDEEKGSVRRFVSFIGERIWGAWGQ